MCIRDRSLTGGRLRFCCRPFSPAPPESPLFRLPPAAEYPDFVPAALIAEMGVYGGVNQIVLLVVGEPIPKLPDAAGIDKGPFEPPGR